MKGGYFKLLKNRATVRAKLAEFSLTQTWLMCELEKNGVTTHKSELCSVLKGDRFGDKAEKIINTALSILQKYEEYYVKAS